MLTVATDDKEVTIVEDGWICVETYNNSSVTVMEWKDLNPADIDAVKTIKDQIEALQKTLVNLAAPSKYTQYTTLTS
jgi:hypothetical protein